MIQILIIIYISRLKRGTIIMTSRVSDCSQCIFGATPFSQAKLAYPSIDSSRSIYCKRSLLNERSPKRFFNDSVTDCLNSSRSRHDQVILMCSLPLRHSPVCSDLSEASKSCLCYTLLAFPCGFPKMPEKVLNESARPATMKGIH